MKKLVAAASLFVPAVAFAHPGHGAEPTGIDPVLGVVAVVSTIGVGFAIARLLRQRSIRPIR